MMPHSQNKSIFDAECGAPNPLITLANNYGQSITSRGNTGAETYLRQLVPGGSGTGELLAEEYLARVAKQTPLPESFNTELLLRSVQAGPLSNLSLYEALWHGALRPEPAISLGEVWANQLSSRQSPAINDVWAAEYLSRASDDVKHLPSASNLADEYLDRFKDMQVEDSRFAREWADDFLHTKASARSNFDQFEEEWRNIQREQERYRFSAVNPYKEEGEGKVRQDLLESARRELAAGNISNGILQLEAHLHDSPQDSEAWCELGLCHAENEQDAQAIRAFRSCLKTSAPTNRKALLALSVSLANEGLEGAALLELEKWIHALADPQTKEFPMKDMLDGTVIDNGQFKEVEGRFESRLAVLGPMDAPEKAELLSAFGVLYNLNRAYDRAVDCIQQALQIRPEDAVLWNRLGATLANSEQSVEAIGAYRQALHLFPTYVRARYNLGICCMNLRSYRDAVGHFLTAIQLQSSNNSEIWSQLRSACIRLTDDPNVPFLDMMQALNSRDLTRLLSLFPVEQLVT